MRVRVAASVRTINALRSAGQQAQSFTGSFLLSSEGTIKYVSPQLQQALGEQFNCWITDLLQNKHEVYFTREICLLKKIPGGVKELVLHHPSQPGRLRNIRLTNMLDLPAVEAIVCQVYDVPDRDLLHGELFQSETFFRSIFTNNPLPIIICEQASLRLLHSNDKAIELFGFGREEMKQMCLTQLQCDQRKNRLSLLRSKVRTGLARKSQVVLKTKFDKLLVVDISTHEVVYREQQAFLLMLNDRTREIELQEALTKEKINQQKIISRATLDGQEKQRRELSMEMHDSINPTLASVKLMLTHGLAAPEQLPQIATNCVQWLDNTIEEIRRLSKTLAPPSLQNTGLADAVNDVVEALRMVSKINITKHVHLPAEADLDEGLKICLFRIIQEQVNNVLKYAGATQLEIRVQQSADSLHLSIQDNGKGFDLRARRQGIGINNIYNRAEMFNGKVKFQTAPGHGCRLAIDFPL